MIILKTVLKTGGEYKPEHVLRIKKMLEMYVKCPARFVCYTDLPAIEGVETRPLLHDWPGWWSKIEIFRDAEESFYIDLDMTVQGDITDMVMIDRNFVALRNLSERIGGIGSAMMKWKGDFSHLYETFESDPEYHIKKNSRIHTPFHGDQGFIWSHLNIKPDFFQKKFPKRIKKFNSGNADVLVYYGKNRPWGSEK